WWLTYTLVSLPLIGARMRALAELLHQSTHGTLTRSRTLGFLLGTLGAGYLVFQGWHSYRKSHVLNHHIDLGSDRDPDTTYHIQLGLYNSQSNHAFIWKNLIAPLLFLKTPSKLLDLLRYRFFSVDEPRDEKALKLTYLIALVVGITASGFGVQ